MSDDDKTFIESQVGICEFYDRNCQGKKRRFLNTGVREDHAVTNPQENVLQKIENMYSNVSLSSFMQHTPFVAAALCATSFPGEERGY